MTWFFFRAAMASLGLWLASNWVDGLDFDSGGTLIVAAFLPGIVNALVRPLLIVLTLPFTVLTLGLFLLVVNGIMMALVAALLPGFSIESFWDAFWGSIIVSLVGAVAGAVVGPRGRIQVTIHREEDRRK